MQETSNIIPYNICKGQIFEEINKGTAWHSMAQHYGTAGGGGGVGECLQGNLWYSPPASMTPHLASVTFKMASKVHVFIEETDKNFDLIMEILFRFLGFGDFPIAIEN